MQQDSVFQIIVDKGSGQLTVPYVPIADQWIPVTLSLDEVQLFGNTSTKYFTYQNTSDRGTLLTVHNPNNETDAYIQVQISLKITYDAASRGNEGDGVVTFKLDYSSGSDDIDSYMPFVIQPIFVGTQSYSTVSASTNVNFYTKLKEGATMFLSYMVLTNSIIKLGIPPQGLSWTVAVYKSSLTTIPLIPLRNVTKRGAITVFISLALILIVIGAIIFLLSRSYR